MYKMNYNKQKIDNMYAAYKASTPTIPKKNEDNPLSSLTYPEFVKIHKNICEPMAKCIFEHGFNAFTMPFNQVYGKNTDTIDIDTSDK